MYWASASLEDPDADRSNIFALLSLLTKPASCVEIFLQATLSPRRGGWKRVAVVLTVGPGDLNYDYSSSMTWMLNVDYANKDDLQNVVPENEWYRLNLEIRRRD